MNFRKPFVFRFARQIALICLAVLECGRAAVYAQSLCDLSAEEAADATGVPLRVLKAVTRLETGKNQSGQLEPWPWTVNIAGKGYWFDSINEAQNFVSKNLRSGARNVDIGCFQINYRWHSHAFQSIRQMFDPDENGLYAARFLLQLYDEFDDWEKAVGAYHSRTQKHSQRYLNRFRLVRARLETIDPSEIVVENKTRPAIALIPQGSGGRRSPGSLVALSFEPSEQFLDLN